MAGWRQPALLIAQVAVGLILGSGEKNKIGNNLGPIKHADMNNPYIEGSMLMTRDLIDDNLLAATGVGWVPSLGAVSRIGWSILFNIVWLLLIECFLMSFLHRCFSWIMSHLVYHSFKFLFDLVTKILPYSYFEPLTERIEMIFSLRWYVYVEYPSSEDDRKILSTEENDNLNTELCNAMTREGKLMDQIATLRSYLDAERKVSKKLKAEKEAREHRIDPALCQRRSLENDNHVLRHRYTAMWRKLDDALTEVEITRRCLLYTQVEVKEREELIDLLEWQIDLRDKAICDLKKRNTDLSTRLMNSAPSSSTTLTEKSARSTLPATGSKANEMIAESKTSTADSTESRSSDDCLNHNGTAYHLAPTPQNVDEIVNSCEVNESPHTMDDPKKSTLIAQYPAVQETEDISQPAQPAIVDHQIQCKELATKPVAESARPEPKNATSGDSDVPATSSQTADVDMCTQKSTSGAQNVLPRHPAGLNTADQHLHTQRANLHGQSQSQGLASNSIADIGHSSLKDATTGKSAQSHKQVTGWNTFADSAERNEEVEREKRRVERAAQEAKEDSTGVKQTASLGPISETWRQVTPRGFQRRITATEKGRVFDSATAASLSTRGNPVTSGSLAAPPNNGIPQSNSPSPSVAHNGGDISAASANVRLPKWTAKPTAMPYRPPRERYALLDGLPESETRGDSPCHKDQGHQSGTHIPSTSLPMRQPNLSSDATAGPVTPEKKSKYRRAHAYTIRKKEQRKAQRLKENN